ASKGPVARSQSVENAFQTRPSVVWPCRIALDYTTPTLPARRFAPPTPSPYCRGEAVGNIPSAWRRRPLPPAACLSSCRTAWSPAGGAGRHRVGRGSPVLPAGTGQSTGGTALPPGVLRGESAGQSVARAPWHRSVVGVGGRLPSVSITPE